MLYNNGGVYGIRQEEDTPRRGGMVLREDMKSFGLSAEDAQDWNKQKRKVKGATG